MRRRSRMEVIADILVEALNGANKTRVMYRANLNFLRFERYLSELLEKELMVELNNPRSGVIYRTTDKGRELLRMLKKVQETIHL